MSDALGCDPSLLVPFIAAWRGAPATLDFAERTRYVASILHRIDHAVDTKVVAQLAEHLDMFLGDVRRTVDSGYAALGPEDTTCVCCGATSLRSSGHMTSASHNHTVQLFGLGESHAAVKVYERICDEHHGDSYCRRGSACRR